MNFFFKIGPPPPPVFAKPHPPNSGCGGEETPLLCAYLYSILPSEELDFLVMVVFPANFLSEMLVGCCAPFSFLCFCVDAMGLLIALWLLFCFVLFCHLILCYKNYFKEFK